MKLFPKEGFKFGCGFDICTFPKQYCDKDENRCSYCSEDVCNCYPFPEQCDAECNSLKMTTSSLIDGPDIGNVNTNYDKNIIILYTLSILALSLSAILFARWFIKILEKHMKTKSKTDYKLLRIDNQRKVLKQSDKMEAGNAGLEREQPTAPPNVNVTTDIPFEAVVTHPDNDSASYNLGDHNILSSHNDSITQSVLASDQSNGPVSQPENEYKCDKLDHNILNNGQDYKVGIPDSNEHAVMTSSVNQGTSNESLSLDTKVSELTRAKEQTRSDKVC